MAQAHLYHQLFRSLATKKVDVSSDVFKMMLLTGSYTPNLGTHQYQSDLTNELPSGSGYTTGGNVVPSVAVSMTSVNCVQILTIAGSPASGGFEVAVTIGVDTETTPQIAYNAAATAVQNAIAALPNVGVGNVTVTGSAGGPYTVTFVHSLGAQAIPLMGVVNLLGGGTTPTITPTMSTVGVGLFALTANNVDWPSATFADPNGPRYGAIVDVTPGTSSVNPLVALVDFVTEQTPNNATLSVTWNGGITAVQIS